MSSRCRQNRATLKKTASYWALLITSSQIFGRALAQKTIDNKK
jgi:hypothetical protein